MIDQNEDVEMAYPVDLRERVLANLKEESMRRTAKRFRMSLSSVYRIKRHDEETGQLKAKALPGRLPAIHEQGEAWLRALIDQESDLTLATLCERYEQSKLSITPCEVMHQKQPPLHRSGPGAVEWCFA